MGATDHRAIDQLALERLSDAYATAVDRRELEALRACFLPAGRLVMVSGARQPRVYDGHAGLAQVMTELAPFAATVHHVTTRQITGDGGDRACGRVACVAHHITAGGSEEGATDLVLHVAYDDAYGRGDDGRWRFAERLAHVLFSERRPVRLP